MSKSDRGIAGKREEERGEEGSERGEEECSEGRERGKEDSEGLSRSGYGRDGGEDQEDPARERRTKGVSSQRIEIDANTGKCEEESIAIDITLHPAPGWGTGVPVPIPGVSGHCKVNGRGDPCQRIDAKNKDDHGAIILNGAEPQAEFVTSLEDDSAEQRGKAPEKGQQPGSSSQRKPHQPGSSSNGRLGRVH